MSVSFETTDTGLRVSFGEEGHRDFSWRWLRDHGEDPHSLDPVTGQRLVETFSLPSVLTAESVTISGADVVIAWSGEATETSISIETLKGVSGALVLTDERVSWTSTDSPDSLEALDVDQFMVSDDGLEEALRRLERNGFAILGNLSDDIKLTAAVVERFGGVRKSIFGEVWSVESEAEPLHADSAYSSVALEPHTDGTYMNDGPGYQLFHFVKAADHGGASILVDGLAVFEQLQEQHPEHVDVLSSVQVPALYKEPGVHLQTARPALRLDENGWLVQLSFNNYDRAPMWLPPAQMEAFYAAYTALHQLIIDPANFISRSLDHGEALIFNNWRVLHGRSAFGGSRKFQGAYLNQEDVASRWRTLKAGTLV